MTVKKLAIFNDIKAEFKLKHLLSCSQKQEYAY